MWCAYIREILALAAQNDSADNKPRAHITPTAAGPMLASADFHGSLMQVVRSRCISRVGVQGIVVKDTKFTFELITRQNELKSMSGFMKRLRINFADSM